VQHRPLEQLAAELIELLVQMGLGLNQDQLKMKKMMKKDPCCCEHLS
jgi:hypothetical protein